MALRVTLEVRNRGGLESFINATEQKILEGMKAFGEIALNELVNQIQLNSGKNRPGQITGKLANVIKNNGVEFTYNPLTRFATVGIGNYRSLRANPKSRYFYVLDYGVTYTGKKFIPPFVKGSFEGSAPNASMVGKGTQTFQKDGTYSMQPKSFRPINYSSKANMVLQGQWDNFWGLFLKK